MGKKKHSSGHVSQGSRISSMKTASAHTSAERMLYKMDALSKGKDVYFTVPNPNKADTSRRFIRMKVSGKEFLQRQQYSHKMKGAE
jgi:hypothetical protein